MVTHGDFIEGREAWRAHPLPPDHCYTCRNPVSLHGCGPASRVEIRDDVAHVTLWTCRAPHSP